METCQSPKCQVRSANSKFQVPKKMRNRDRSGRKRAEVVDFGSSWAFYEEIGAEKKPFGPTSRNPRKQAQLCSVVPGCAKSEKFYALRLVLRTQRSILFSGFFSFLRFFASAFANAE